MSGEWVGTGERGSGGGGGEEAGEAGEAGDLRPREINAQVAQARPSSDTAAHGSACEGIEDGAARRAEPAIGELTEDRAEDAGPSRALAAQSLVADEVILPAEWI